MRADSNTARPTARRQLATLGGRSGGDDRSPWRRASSSRARSRSSRLRAISASMSCSHSDSAAIDTLFLQLQRNDWRHVPVFTFALAGGGVAVFAGGVAVFAGAAPLEPGSISESIWWNVPSSIGRSVLPSQVEPSGSSL